MPRRPKGYSEHGKIRDQFAIRMTEEQEEQGLSDAGLAKRANAIFPMSAPSIWKIRKGKPPKRIDLDEGFAIAKACGYPTVEDFLLGPPTRWSVHELHVFKDRVDSTIETLESWLIQVRGDRQRQTWGYARLMDTRTHQQEGSLETPEDVNRVRIALTQTLESLESLRSAIDQLELGELISHAKQTIEALDGIERNYAGQTPQDGEPS